MYDECRYETAWFPHKKSIWCYPFTLEELEVRIDFFYSDKEKNLRKLFLGPRISSRLKILL